MPVWPITNPFNPPTEPGIDYGTPVGTPVYAPISGRATVQNTGGSGWGKSVQIRPTGFSGSGKGPSSPFGVVGAGHLNDYVVSSGQQVSQGQLIGHTGNTGNSTGPHVEVFIKNAAGQWLNPGQYPNIVEGFFHANPALNPFGSSSSGDSGNPISDALNAALGPIGSAITGAEQNFVSTLTNVLLMVVGGIIMLAGIGLLVYATTGFNALGAASNLTPVGRAATVAKGASKAATGGSSQPAAPKLSTAAQEAVSEARAGRGRKLSPEVKTELRRAS